MKIEMFFHHTKQREGTLREREGWLSYLDNMNIVQPNIMLSVYMEFMLLQVLWS
ncbi:MAG: hypothetical protein ABJB05_12235 [Parafilimonas sp.]